MSGPTLETPHPSLLVKLSLTLRMIKFSHSIFALPFALAAVLFATNGRPQPIKLLLIILAMILARNAAMSFNRLVDARLDAQNPRTRNREIPAGLLSSRFAAVFCALNAAALVYVSSLFNYLSFILSPIALIIILGYSLTKRFTHATQFFLGLALGISPIAAWIAITARLEVFPVLIGMGVFFWVAGFDLIYSTQDYAHDLQHGLKNLVVWLGIARALFLSRILHGLCFGCFILAGMLRGLHLSYFLGLILMAAVVAYEHYLVRPEDLSRVNTSFFTLNGCVSLLFLGFSWLSLSL